MACWEFGLKILHVITGLDLGGAERTLERLVLADTSNEHIVVSLQWPGPIGERLREGGIQVEALHLEPGRMPGLRAIGRLRKIIRTSQSDVVQSWMYHSNLLVSTIGRVRGKRAICWNIRRYSFEGNTLPLSTRVVARLGGLLSYVLPDAVVYCAYSAAERHQALGYNSRRAAVIHNGIDMRKFSPSAASRAAIRKELGIDPDAPLIGSIGRYHPDKDHATLLKAVQQVAEKHADIRCLLVGSGLGPENPELVRMVAELGLSEHVVLLGARVDVPAILNALDLHVTSSLTEGFPNVILEAMACGTPCVTTDVGDARRIVGDHGWIVPTRSPAELAAAISEALEMRSSPRWKDLSEAARAHCKETFSVPAMVGAYRKLWSSLSDQRNPNSPKD